MLNVIKLKGCKKCGGVVHVKLIVFKVQEGKIQDHFGNLDILCKKFGNPVAKVAIVQAR